MVEKGAVDDGLKETVADSKHLSIAGAIQLI